MTARQRATDGSIKYPCASQEDRSGDFELEGDVVINLSGDSSSYESASDREEISVDCLKIDQFFKAQKISASTVRSTFL